MATHSSILAWRIPWTVEPGGLPSLGSYRVGHDWSNLAVAAAGLRVPWLPLFALLSCGPKPPSGGSVLWGQGGRAAYRVMSVLSPGPPWLLTQESCFLPQAFSSNDLSPTHSLLCWKWRSLPPGLLFLLVFLRLFRSYGLSCQLPSFVYFWNLYGQRGRPKTGK